jgi:hypothetical protein
MLKAAECPAYLQLQYSVVRLGHRSSRKLPHHTQSCTFMESINVHPCSMPSIGLLTKVRAVR